MFSTDKKHVAERAKIGIVAQPLNAAQTSELVSLLKTPEKGEEQEYVKLISDRVPPGVDEAAYVKAAFLAAVAKGEASSPLIGKEMAVKVGFSAPKSLLEFSGTDETTRKYSCWARCKVDTT